MAKKRGKAKKHSTVKKKKDMFWLHIILIIIALVIIGILFSKMSDNSGEMSKQETDEKKIEITEIVENGNELTFTIYNPYDMTADCYYTIKGADSFSKGIGFIKPNTKKVFTEYMESYTSIGADCTWREYDIQGCEQGTFALCDGIRAGDIPESCLTDRISYNYFCAAFLNEDTSYCSYIRYEPELTHCFAYVQKNPEMCTQATRGQDWCFEDFATNYNNLELCDRIVDENTRKSCIAVITGNLDLCLNISGSQHDSCLIHLASRTHDLAPVQYCNNQEICARELSWLK